MWLLRCSRPSGPAGTLPPAAPKAMATTPGRPVGERLPGAATPGRSCRRSYRLGRVRVVIRAPNWVFVRAARGRRAVFPTWGPFDPALTLCPRADCRS